MITRKEIIEEAQMKYRQILNTQDELHKLLLESSPTWLDDIFELKRWTYNPKFAPPEISVSCDKAIFFDFFTVKLKYMGRVYMFNVYPDKVEEVENVVEDKSSYKRFFSILRD